MGYDTSLLNANDRGGLTWPSETMIFFCATCIDVTKKNLDDENLLNEFYSSSTSSCAGIKVIKHCMMECSNNSPLLTDIHEICEGCNKSRKITAIEKCLGATSRIGINNLTQLLNKKRMQQAITLSMIKRDRKKNHQI